MFITSRFISFRSRYSSKNHLVRAKFYSLMCDALDDLVPCAQFKKREKHP